MQYTNQKEVLINKLITELKELTAECPSNCDVNNCEKFELCAEYESAITDLLLEDI